MAAKKKAKGPAKSPAPKKRRPIAYDPNSPRAIAFCERYAVHLRPTDAAREAGFAAGRAKVTACELLQLPGVQARIQALLEAKSQRTAIEADAVIQRFWAIATADANEIAEYRRTCCRHCYGVHHDYQRTQRERDRDHASWQASVEAFGKLTEAQQKVTPRPRETFDEQGGIGWDPRKDPNPACPECFGAGVEGAHFKDTRKLSAGAKALYAGVKLTKDGLELKTHSQTDALLQVGRHLGLFKDKLEVDVTDNLADALKRARERVQNR